MFQVDPGAEALITALAGGYMFKVYKDGRPSAEVDKTNAHSHIGESCEYGACTSNAGQKESRTQRTQHHTAAAPPKIRTRPEVTMDTQPPEINEPELNKLGERLFRVFGTYKTDRLAIEQRWIENLLQYRGVYSDKVKAMIPADRSKAYPRMTAWMVKGTVARLLQIAFPQTERNYQVTQSRCPTSRPINCNRFSINW